MRKVALVTGASRGLGAHVARALAGAGYRVAVNYRRDEEAARRVAAELPEGLSIRGDVGSAAEVSGMAGLLEERWGRLDVLVNNAGIVRDALLLALGEEDWDQVMRTNLAGCFHTTKLLSPLMALSGGGHVVNVSSRAAFRGGAGQAAYSASKAALLGLTASAARELAGDNIRVNAVLPGYMATDMGRSRPGAVKRARKESLLGRLADPGEAASFVAWLAGTEGITGQVFSLDSRP
jgi:3-oxoacyl-[acyl-carrier protein] reductase